MKKSVKAIIALLVIIALAVGVYFIFFNGTDNKQIRAKVYGLNNNVVVKDINIYEKINDTVLEMLDLIDSRSFNIPEVEEYLTEYKQALEKYSVVKEYILEYGIFVNNADTNKYFDRMNKAYSNLVGIYKDSNEYLLGTYFAVTNPANHNKDFIVSFQFKFKDALKELNNFYYNAGMAFSFGTKNLFEINNLFKLKVGNYCTAVYCRVNDYLDNQVIDNYHTIPELKTGREYLDKYLTDKSEYDSLINAKLDVSDLILAKSKGEADSYINGFKKEKQKSSYEKYYNLIVKG